MIKLFTSFGGLVLAILALWLYNPTPKHTHTHAGFRIYLNGVLQDYSDPKYMNYTLCSEHDEQKTPVEEQMERAHLHDQVGDVVHVHRAEATWGDLLANINVDLGEDLSAYVNGEKVADIFDQEITAYSTAIFVLGEDNQVLGKEVIPIERIKQVESASELCGTT